MQKWSIGWGITQECNMNCAFCYSKDVRKKQKKLRIEDCKSFIEKNASYIDNINYGTGESSLCDWWYDLIDYIRTNYPQLGQAVTTNGFLAEKMEKSDYIKQIFCRCIDEIDVSLDFYDEDKHCDFRGNKSAYKWAINMLEKCYENNKKTTIVFIGTNETLSKDNIDGLFSLARKYSAKVRMNIYRPTSNNIEINKRFIADYEKIIEIIYYINEKYKVLSLSDPLFNSILSEGSEISDPSGASSIRILPDGSITPSTYLITKEYLAANIKELKSLDDLKKYVVFNEIAIADIPKECNTCMYKDSCRGGVVDRRYLWNKTINSRDPYCPYEQGKDFPKDKIVIKNKHSKISIHDGYLPTMFFE